MSDRIDPEELEAVWQKFLKGGDEVSHDRLIVHYLPLVKYVVGRLALTLPSHVKVEDMYSSGVLGLMKAVEKYDPTRKNKFETYAVLLIKGAIIDEMRSLDWVPRSVHQKASQISEAQSALQQRLGRQPTDEEVATQLGVSLEEYNALLDRVRPAIFLPLTLNADRDGERGPLSERIPDEKAKTSFETAEYNEFRSLLEKAVMELPEQERTVLVLYYYENLMLKEIGKAIGVTESRVSQIHTKALLRLRGRLKVFAQEFANLC